MSTIVPADPNTSHEDREAAFLAEHPELAAVPTPAWASSVRLDLPELPDVDDSPEIAASMALAERTFSRIFGDYEMTQRVTCDPQTHELRIYPPELTDRDGREVSTAEVRQRAELAVEGANTYDLASYPRAREV